MTPSPPTTSPTRPVVKAAEDGVTRLPWSEWKRVYGAHVPQAGAYPRRGLPVLDDVA